MVRAVRFAPGRPDQLRSCGLDQRLLLHDRRLDATVAAADAGVPLTALSCRHDGLMAVGTAGVRTTQSLEILPRRLQLYTSSSREVAGQMSLLPSLKTFAMRSSVNRPVMDLC